MFQKVSQVVTFARYVHLKVAFSGNPKNCSKEFIAMQQKNELRKYAVHYSAKMQVLGSGAPGVPPCIYLMATGINYLFNCGEGTQRLSQEYRCRLSRLNCIFITHASWKNMGGLAGLLLTAQSNGLRTLNIHCPGGLREYLDTISTFTNLPFLKINCMPVGENDCYEDGIMKVSYIPLVRSLSDSEEKEEGVKEEEKEAEEKEAEEKEEKAEEKEEKEEKAEEKEEEEECVRTSVNRKRPAEESEEENGQAGKRSKVESRVVCYVLQIPERLGKLMPSKCIQHGIGPGPLYFKLKQGLSVTKEDGTVVRSSDVCMPANAKITLLVVECPTEEYLDSLTSNSAFMKYQETAEYEEDRACCVFHFSPEHIINDKRYQNWMKKFAMGTEHVILNEANTCVASAAIYKNQYLLNMLHPKIFPLLNSSEFSQDKEMENEFIHRGRVCDTIELRPRKKNLTKQSVHKPAQDYLDEVCKIPSFKESLEETKKKIAKMSAELNLENIPEYPQIVMLGTGCSVPNKIRNTSSILLRITKSTSILLDCGEGTLGQLIRLYGIAKADQILRSLKAIYVSHFHADHHLGLLDLLLYRKKLTGDRLFLLIPKTLMPWLTFCNQQFDNIASQYVTINNNDIYHNYHRLPKCTETVLLNSLNLKCIDTVYVTHCNLAYGISITFADDKKLVYSGDTMFSKNLISLGTDCDILIHEATMEDGLEMLAKRNLHSTTSEAIRAGKLMNAKFILLTHFSQRYAKTPYIPVQETNVGLAYDNMEIQLPQLPLLPLFYPCIKIMFQDYIKEIDQ